MKYVIGNWKANKNIQEVREWIEAFMSHDLNVFRDTISIVICPPDVYISELHAAFQAYPHIHTGAQDISRFFDGPHTGEISAENLEGLVDFVLIGHSERREEFHETDADVDTKVQQAHRAHIEPIVLVRSSENKIPEGVHFVAYEPVDSIGTGRPASLEDVIGVKKLLNLSPDSHYIYGGSVDSKNVGAFIQSPEIDGVLPGTASLDPHEFYAICQACAIE
jgi:triosephosphate isomerase